MTFHPLPAAHPAYRADIDGLRAVAVLLVLVFHFNLTPGGKAGFIGVDIFFVISGFLITSLVKQQLDSGTFSLLTFYANRIRRLAPALFVALLLTLCVGCLFLFPSDLKELGRQALLSQFYVANIYFWKSISYFGLHAGDVFLLHTWSLAIEEQFYLIFPVAFVVAYRKLGRFLPAALASAAVLSFSLNLFFVASKPEATFYLLPTRAWELLAGALLVYLPRISARLQVLLGWLGLCLIVSGVVMFGPETRFPGYFVLLPTAGAACLIVAGASSPVSKMLSQPGLVYIGRISYPLYLVHWPINVFAVMTLAQDYTAPWRAGMLLLSLMLAAAIFHCIEDPIRRRRFLVTNRRVVGAYATGLLGTVLAFIVLIGTAGLPGRFPAEVVRLASFSDDKTPDLSECHYSRQGLLGAASFCRIGTPEAKPQWLVYGDSHAWSAHDGLDKWLRAKNQGGYFMFRYSCPPLTGVHLFRDKGDCFAFNQAIMKFLETDTEIEGVFLVSAWIQAKEAVLTSSSEIPPDIENSLKLFRARFPATVKQLNALGKQVYIWEPVPGARNNVPAALAKAELWNKPSNQEIGREEYLRTFDFFFSALSESLPGVTKTVPTGAALCASGRCAVTVNGMPIYFDNSHVTRSSSNYWASVILKAERDKSLPAEFARLGDQRPGSTTWSSWRHAK